MLFGYPTFGIELRPTQLSEPFTWISHKSSPSMLHCSFQLFLRCRFRKPRNQLRVPKYHVHVYPMISSTSRIESRIVPICEVTKSPSGYASADPVCRLLSGGACKCLYVERVPFCVSKIGALGIHRDLVESSLVICVAEKIWLFVV